MSEEGARLGGRLECLDCLRRGLAAAAACEAAPQPEAQPARRRCARARVDACRGSTQISYRKHLENAQAN